MYGIDYDFNVNINPDNYYKTNDMNPSTIRSTEGTYFVLSKKAMSMVKMMITSEVVDRKTLLETVFCYCSFIVYQSQHNKLKDIVSSLRRYNMSDEDIIESAYSHIIKKYNHIERYAKEAREINSPECFTNNITIIVKRHLLDLLEKRKKEFITHSEFTTFPVTHDTYFKNSETDIIIPAFLRALNEAALNHEERLLLVTDLLYRSAVSRSIQTFEMDGYDSANAPYIVWSTLASASLPEAYRPGGFSVKFDKLFSPKTLSYVLEKSGLESFLKLVSEGFLIKFHVHLTFTLGDYEESALLSMYRSKSANMKMERTRQAFLIVFAHVYEDMLSAAGPMIIDNTISIPLPKAVGLPEY